MVTTSRIHVLQVLGNAIVGGMETYVQRLIERLPGEQFAITAMCPFESPLTERLRALGVDTLIASMPPDDPSWAALQTTCALVQYTGVDVLHAHLPNAHMLAALAGRMTGKPVVTTIHGSRLTTTDLEVHRCTGSHINVVCRQTFYHALGLGVDPDRISVIPNGVDTKLYTPAGTRDAALRRELGVVDPQAPLVGMVGRLSREKGPDCFVRVAALVRRKAPRAHFVLVGTGPMRGELELQIRAERLSGHVHLAGLRRDLPAVYNELDLLVSTSRSEAMPLALMEAMACGVPVVATRAGGVADLVEHEVTGFLVGERDVEAATEAIVALLATSDKRRQMAKAARARALARFDLDDNIAQVAQLLARLAAPRSAPVTMSAIGTDTAS